MSSGKLFEEFKTVHEIRHPLIEDKLMAMRRKDTSTKDFRERLEEIAALMTYEVGREFETHEIEIETPIASCKGRVVDDKSFVIVPILRAGLGMSGGVLKMLPTAAIGHIGLYRDEKTLKPVEYYSKMPPNLSEKTLLVVDPMLATGGSCVAALTLLKEKGAKKIILMCLVAAPEGVRAVATAHPDVPVYIASIDEKLNEHGYIVPGLGDAGDRIFGTL